MPTYDVTVSLWIGELYPCIKADSAREAEKKASKEFADYYGIDGRGASWSIEADADELEDEGEYSVDVDLHIEDSYEIEASSAGEAESEAKKQFAVYYDIESTGAEWNVAASAEEIEEDIDEEEEDE